METKRIMGVGINIWGCREQFKACEVLVGI